MGCSVTFSYHSPVLLQYSHDAGRSWQLLQPPCDVTNDCHGNYTDGSIYYTGTYGEWKLVVIPLDAVVTSKYVTRDCCSRIEIDIVHRSC